MRLAHRRGRIAAFTIAGTLAAAAPAAHADFFVTFDTMSPNLPPPHTEIAKFNATTGVVARLPAGVNTGANELHPALSPDGRRMVFQRIDPAAGTNRIIVVDLATGQSADVFSGFEVAADPPTTPIFSLDGTKVITGRKLQRIDPSAPAGTRQATVTETSLANFPNGPFPKTIVDLGGPDHDKEGRTMHLAPGPSGRLAYSIDTTDNTRTMFVRNSAGVTNGLASSRHPTMSEAAGLLVYEKAIGLPAKVSFSPLSTFGSIPPTSTSLPSIVNASGQDVSRPALTADGRYLGFVREVQGLFKAFIWDSQTQLLLNPQGVGFSSAAGSDEFEALARNEGNVALTFVPVFNRTAISLNSVRFSLRSRSDVGIIVQRIVGKTRVFGKSAPKLRFVGRVPLGRNFKAGRKTHRVKWNFKVNGRKLRPGKYLITPRSVTRKAKVRDLGRPTRIKIRR
jgi:hypothetical protein